jgi:DNA-directed RNA polymerase specialized sigma24 family protein
MPPERNTTALLNEQAIDELLERVLARLRALARVVKGGNAVETDELVDGAIVKLFVGKEPPRWDDSDHFFKFVACAMRQVLIDHRRKFRPTESVGADDVAAPRSNSPEEGVTFDDLSAFLAEQMQRELRDDPDALRVMQELLFGGEDGESVKMTEVARRLGLEYHTAIRARHRGMNVLKRILRNQLGA